jgi:hypothetical protein
LDPVISGPVSESMLPVARSRSLPVTGVRQRAFSLAGVFVRQNCFQEISGSAFLLLNDSLIFVQMY